MDKEKLNFDERKRTALMHSLVMKSVQQQVRESSVVTPELLHEFVPGPVPVLSKSDEEVRLLDNLRLYIQCSKPIKIVVPPVNSISSHGKGSSRASSELSKLDEEVCLLENLRHNIQYAKPIKNVVPPANSISSLGKGSSSVLAKRPRERLDLIPGGNIAGGSSTSGKSGGETVTTGADTGSSGQGGVISLAVGASTSSAGGSVTVSARLVSSSAVGGIATINGGNSATGEGGASKINGGTSTSGEGGCINLFGGSGATKVLPAYSFGTSKLLGVTSAIPVPTVFGSSIAKQSQTGVFGSMCTVPSFAEVASTFPSISKPQSQKFGVEISLATVTASNTTQSVLLTKKKIKSCTSATSATPPETTAASGNITNAASATPPETASDGFSITNILSQAPFSDDHERVLVHGTLGFCCYNCRCGPSQKSNEFITENVRFEVDPHYFHRLCCHSAENVSKQKRIEDYLFCSLACEKTMRNMANPCFLQCQMKRREFKSMYKEAMKQNTMLKTELSVPGLVMIYTNEGWLKAHKSFNIIKNKCSTQNKKAAVVVDFFSGIGSALVVLKKLGIKIEAYITVEHDPAAKFVCMSNHSNGSTSTSCIQHMHVDKFEEFNLDVILEKFGPIDLIIGGPPCVDYSKVNANRQGIQGKQGKYLLAFANLIDQIRNHCLQQQNPLFFLCENVPISFEDGLTEIENGFKISGVRVDAKYFSQCKRDRIYFTNIPVEDIEWEENHDLFPADFAFFADGWMLPAEAYVAYSSKISMYEKSSALKANTFMAGESRINDDRMLKVRYLAGTKKLFEYMPFSVKDRERMLGFPEGYVQKPVENLFLKLSKCFTSDNWTEVDDCRALSSDFSGRQYKFSEQKTDFNNPFFDVKLGAPPATEKTQYFLNADGYAKRLLGNAFSISVVEHFLKPLRQIFATHEYEGYQMC